LTETTSVGVRLPKQILKYVEEQAKRENVDRSVMMRRFMERGIEEFKKDKAASLYAQGKLSISGAADMATLTIPEMVQFLVERGYRSSYSLEDYRRGVELLEKKLKEHT